MTNNQRLRVLARVKNHLQKAVDVIEKAEWKASDDDSEEFLNFNLKNSIECAMEEVDEVIDNLDEYLPN